VSEAANRWLPTGAASPALDRDLAALVTDWAQAWFGFALAGQGGLRDGGPDRAEGVRYALGDDIAIVVAGEGLGILALGLREGDAHSDADRGLIDRIGEAVCTDLQRRVAAMVADGRSDWTGPVDRPAWQPVRWQRFGDAAGRLAVTLCLGERCFETAFFARLPGLTPPVPLTPLSQAVQTQPVRLSARLGRCTLRLAEMRDMVVGDTLLFDAPVATALPVVVDGATTGVAAARVVRESMHWTLQLESCAFQRAA
jgi:hypothetical protein